MKSLYDVFTAIRADEGDHVSAMQACLDPETSLRSPSVERTILMQVAALTVASVLLSSGLATMDDFESFSGSSETVDAIANGASGLVGIEDQGESFLGLGADVLEGGVVMEALRRAVQPVLEAIARFLAALL